VEVGYCIAMVDLLVFLMMKTKKKMKMFARYQHWLLVLVVEEYCTTIVDLVIFQMMTKKMAMARY